MGIFTSSAPPLTETNVPDQTGKVFIITGASGGIGAELAQILYAQNAKIYIAARSAEKAEQTIQSIKSKIGNSKGELIFLHLDLNDLTGIKKSAQEFLGKENRLDVLWNNAGVMIPPQGSTTKQGYELQLGTNNVAPFLFTKLLTPLLIETAKTASPGSVRVVWVSSSAAARYSPKGGVEVNNLDYKNDRSAWHKYGTSKAGNILHSSEFARRFKDSGVISVSLDPGILKTDLWKHMPRWQATFVNLILKDAIYGAYTELYAGLSPEITAEMNGAFVVPYGKIGAVREDIAVSEQDETEGGTGTARRFWDWTEKEVEHYL